MKDMKTVMKSENMIKINNALIVGNGLSRKNIDIPSLKKYATIYGCNALYRDFPEFDVPDYLIAIDQPIIDEINNSDFPKDRFIVPPYDEQFEPKECNPTRPRSNAGMNAMIEAIRHGHTNLYCIGFDFFVRDRDFSTKNIYDGTNNYGPEHRASYEDNMNRVKYFDWFAQKNPDVTFWVVFNEQVGFHNVKAKNVYGIFSNILVEKLEETIHEIQ